jgi:hypothetical protein
MQAANGLSLDWHDVVYNVLLTRRPAHGDGNLIQLPDFKFLFAAKPRRCGIPETPATKTSQRVVQVRVGLFIPLLVCAFFFRRPGLRPRNYCGLVFFVIPLFCNLPGLGLVVLLEVLRSGLKGLCPLNL